MIWDALDGSCIRARKNNATPFVQVLVCFPSDEELATGVSAKDTIKLLFCHR